MRDQVTKWDTKVVIKCETKLLTECKTQNDQQYWLPNVLVVHLSGWSSSWRCLKKQKMSCSYRVFWVVTDGRGPWFHWRKWFWKDPHSADLVQIPANATSTPAPRSFSTVLCVLYFFSAPSLLLFAWHWYGLEGSCPSATAAPSPPLPPPDRDAGVEGIENVTSTGNS